MRIFLILSFFLVSTNAIAGDPPSRFFLEGDGRLQIANAKSGSSGTFRYRTDDGSYDLKALDGIGAVFGVPVGSKEFLHPRFIALLDYLQDHYKGAAIKIVSGYRSPNYNDGLRKKGKLAAKTSMHIEGMASDIEMEGVEPKGLWEYVRSLNCCGAGYYHGKGIHVDVGPPRFWDETSTKVEQDLGGHNKLVLLRTNFDRYRPGETVFMVLGRVTDYPISIRPKVSLVRGEHKVSTLPLSSVSGDCIPLQDRGAARDLSFVLPNDLHEKDPVVIRIEFCQKPFPEMLDQTDSNPITITD